MGERKSTNRRQKQTAPLAGQKTLASMGKRVGDPATNTMPLAQVKKEPQKAVKEEPCDRDHHIDMMPAKVDALFAEMPPATMLPLEEGAHVAASADNCPGVLSSALAALFDAAAKRESADLLLHALETLPEPV